MASYKQYIGTGILVGAAAVAAYAVSRRVSDAVPSLVDWQRVRAVALNSARRAGPEEFASAQADLTQQYARRVRLSEDLIAKYIGQQLPQQLDQVHVFGRAEWVDANIANFKLLFAPFERVNLEALAGTSAGARIFGGFNQFFLSSQMGILLGYLAQRVLGQYDLALLGHEPLTTGRLYFVEPNIAQLQRRLKLDGEEFRLWIALHETTHAYEFEANPWLRSYMNDLITRYFESVSADFLSFRTDRNAMVALLSRVAGNVLSSDYVLEWVMTNQQREIFRQLQALMCLLEGYSNHVMQEVGSSLLPSYHSMKARFEERAKDKPPLERLFTKLVGLDVKFEQYALGERFVGEVVAQRGIGFMNRVWDSQAHLPTLEEVKAPQRWIARIESVPQST
jgi:coenzyme F420 biosynthesis associated uncharacterized protein